MLPLWSGGVVIWLFSYLVGSNDYPRPANKPTTNQTTQQQANNKPTKQTTKRQNNQTIKQLTKQPNNQKI